MNQEIIQHMKILIIDDTATEREAAIKAVEAAGHEAIVLESLEAAIKQIPQVDGVITDLFYTPFDGDRNDHPEYRTYLRNPPASGLLVAFAALGAKVPVVICTSGNHHGPEMAWIYDGYIAPCHWNGITPPFGWNDQKQWDEAVKLLEAQLTP